jgi:pilus assembly protein CpaE
VVAPISMADIVAVISAIFVDPEAAPIGRSIAFIGAKGGVGSSTIAHNVAWAMSSLFKSEVVVADLDLAFGTANINFDQDPARASPKRSFRRNASTRSTLTGCWRSAPSTCRCSAAPSSLDRIYDFDADPFAEIIDTAQRSAPTAGARRAARLERLDQDDADAGRRSRHHRDAGTREPAQHQELVDTLKKLRPNDAPPKLILNQVGIPKRPEIAPPTLPIRSA